VFPGRITAVSPSADNQSRVFSVEVTIDNPKRLLKPGMIASVEVPAVGSVVNVHFPTVGLAAVVKAPTTPAGYAVYVAEGPEMKTVVRSRAVTLGPMVGNRVSVTEGLRTGERVVVTGASLLHDGDVVRVIPGGTEN
jgi:multidrug efflux pump subunit AcrA (membrane-fusion protein)